MLVPLALAISVGAIASLAVNFALFAAVFGLCVVRLDRGGLAGLCAPAAVAATVGGLVGGWRLLVLFD